MPKPRRNGRLINIAIFLNPSVFFFNDSKDYSQRRDLDDCFKFNYAPKHQRTAKKGDIVVVKKKTFLRACVVDAFTISLKDSDTTSVTYSCWLIDNGGLLETTTIYKLTDDIAAFKPLLKRGCLLNIVPATTKFDEISNEYASSTTDNYEFGTIKQAQEQIFLPGNEIIFTPLDIDNGIHIGEVMIITKDKETFSLADVLLENDLVKEDENCFRQLLKNPRFTDMDAILLAVKGINSHFDEDIFKIAVSPDLLPYDIIGTPSAGRGTTQGCSVQQNLSRRSLELSGKKPGKQSACNETSEFVNDTFASFKDVSASTEYSHGESRATLTKKQTLLNILKKNRNTTSEKDATSDRESSKSEGFDWSFASKLAGVQSSHIKLTPAGMSVESVRAAQRKVASSNRTKNASSLPPDGDKENCAAANADARRFCARDENSSVSSGKAAKMALMKKLKRHAAAAGASSYSSSSSWSEKAANAAPASSENATSRAAKCEGGGGRRFGSSSLSSSLSSVDLNATKNKRTSSNDCAPTSRRCRLSKANVSKHLNVSPKCLKEDLNSSTASGDRNSLSSGRKSPNGSSSSSELMKTSNDANVKSRRKTNASNEVEEANEKKSDAGSCDWSLLSKISTTPCKLKLMPAGSDMSNYIDRDKKTTPVSNSSSRRVQTPISRNSSTKPAEPPGVKEPPPAASCTRIAEAPQKLELKNVSCNCDNCIGWFESNTILFQERSKSPDNEKQPKVIRQPEVLFLTDEELSASSANLQPLDLDETSPRTLLDHKTLVHGCLVPKSVHLRSEVHFHSSIHKSMDRCALTTVRPVQAYAWPSIMRGLHTVIVDTHESGKTTCYLPAVLTFLLEKDRFSELPTRDPGPITIILCSGAQTVEKVNERVHRYLSNTTYVNTPDVLHCVPPFNRHDPLWRNNCDLLIATPAMLVRLLAARTYKLKRVCHVVIDDYDVVCKTFPHQIDAILAACNQTLQLRVVDVGIQLVLTSREWTAPLERTLKRLRAQPVVCIGDYLQAAVYGKVILNVFTTPKDLKLRKLLEIVKANCHIYKTVIVCQTETEIESVVEFLVADGLSVLAVLDSEDGPQIKDTERRWESFKGGNYSILVCTDESLNTSLSIRSASFLVHFSLPPTWTRFTKRFSCLLNNCTSPLVTTKEMRNDLLRCRVSVFIDETNALQFPKLINFMRSLGFSQDKIPQGLVKTTKKLERDRELERQKDEVFLCTDLKQFGRCLNRRACTYRHLPHRSLDVPHAVFGNGIIKYRIVHVKSVTGFCARLMSHVDALGAVTDLSADYVVLPNKMSAHFGKAAHRLSAVAPAVGDMYAVDQSIDLYQRCVVTKILSTDKLENALTVCVYLLDHGSEMTVNVSSLLVLPQELQEFKPQVYEFWLADVGPPDCDTHWSCKSKEKLLRLLEKADYSNGTSYCASQILLQLGQTFWVKDVGVFELLDEFNMNAFKFSFKRALRENHLVEDRPEHMSSLYELCKGEKIDLPDFAAVPAPPKPPKEKQVTPRWAFLDAAEECAHVYFSAAMSDCFFVRHAKYDELLNGLSQDIEKHVERLHRHRSAVEAAEEVEVGKCYLAKDKGSGCYSRVLVREVDGDNWDIFFVDYGDVAYVSREELLPISNELIEKLPFQLIECRLHGVQLDSSTAAASATWSEQSYKTFYDMAYEPGTDYYRNLYVTPLRVESAQITGGKRYSVVVMDTVTDDETLLNRCILEAEGSERAKKADEQLDGVDFFAPLRRFEQQQLEMQARELQELNAVDEEQRPCELEEVVERNRKEGESAEESGGGDDDDEANTWDIVCHDMNYTKDQLWNVLAAKHGTPSEFTPERDSKIRAITSGQEASALPPMEAAPMADHISPPLTWHQTDELLKLSIQLPEEIEYKVMLARNKIFSFRAMFRDKLYKITLHMYSKLDKTFQHSCSGCRVYVTLKKTEKAEWPRLTVDGKKLKNVRYNFDQLPEEKRKKFLDLKEFDVEDLTTENDLVIDESDIDYSDSDYEFVSDDN